MRASLVEQPRPASSALHLAVQRGIAGRFAEMAGNGAGRLRIMASALGILVPRRKIAVRICPAVRAAGRAVVAVVRGSWCDLGFGVCGVVFGCFLDHHERCLSSFLGDGVHSLFRRELVDK
jgi:hypothetical protein